MQKTITMAHIMDCPIITVHTGKHYKALINSGATISLLQYSTYNNIEDGFKTPMQPTTATLNTADGLCNGHLALYDNKSLDYVS